MRLTVVGLLFLLITACNQQDAAKKKGDDADSTNVPDTITGPRNDTIVVDTLRTDSAHKGLLALSEKVLKIIKERNYDSLARYIHPRLGVRFSLYAHIDTLTNQVISGEGIIVLDKSQRKIKWGNYDGTGDPVYLSLNDYFKKFVYDVDFLNAEKKAVNSFLGKGNSLNNLKEVYPGCDFTEFYFPGFDSTYSGMDWKTLRLVFKEYENKNYLVGIVHDQWTT